MTKKVIFFLVLMLGVLFFGVNTISAQPEPEPEELEAPKAWGPRYDENQMDSYWQAVDEDNCATPSLECLVHQTSRFVAIEWVNSIVYPGYKQRTVEDETGSGLNKVTPIAQQGGFVGGITYLMGEMYRYPAARTSIFIADVLENAHIITPAYAQGLGFASLNPVLELWKVFRNVAYMLFVLIFIILGFMIMFRQKIGGQSAVTAQQAIPSVIVSLIFVTFSYAIGGFLIDLMYLVMFMIIGVFGQTAPGLDAGIIDFNILELMGQLFGDVAGFSGNVDIITNFIGSLTESEATRSVLGVVGGLTLSLVIAVAVLIGTFKLFFELLKSYATIVLSIVTAPLVLLSGAFPGKNAFGPWIKNIIAHLSAFPTVLMVVILFYQFTSKATGADTSGGFIPPFLLGRGQAGAITTLMGLAIILALPEIVKDIKKNLGAVEGFGQMVFAAAGGRVGKAGGYAADATMVGAPTLAAGAYSGLRGAQAAYKDKKSRTWRGVWKGAKEGVPQWDRKTGKYLGQKGGMLGEDGGLSRGFRFGQKARKQFDDIKGGRFLQPDNYRQLLENLGDKKDKKAPPKPPKRKAGGQG